MLDSQTAFRVAAEARRRELPAALALIVLSGGIATASLGDALPIGWTGLLVLLLIADAGIYRRLNLREGKIDTAILTRLGGWAAALASAFALLPAMLMLGGRQAGAAAALILLVAGVARFCGPGASGAPRVALAGTAPLALTLLATPVFLAISGRPDWDAALISVIGGFALMAYVVHARLAPGRELHAEFAAMTEEMNARAAAHLELATKLNAARDGASRQRRLAG